MVLAAPKGRALLGVVHAGLLCLSLAACGAGGGGTGAGAGSATGASLASTSQAVEVPAALSGQAPAGKMLSVPAGFGIRVWAKQDKARFMALAPNGDVLLSVPSQGKIVLLRDNGGVAQSFDFATGLKRPQDMVFASINGVTWLYFAESNRVSRVQWQSGQTVMGQAAIVVDNLPDDSTEAGYAHPLKNIAIGPDARLYVAIGSGCNACVEESDPVRGAIYQYAADGSNGRLFARGLRNVEGLDFLPGTNTLWIAANNRDNVKVPLDADVDGDGSSDLGQVVPAYTDNNPAEIFTAVTDGGNYGWPYCNAAPNGAMRDLVSVPDFDLNRNNSVLNCGSVTPPRTGLPAHSAPLGLSFLQASAGPAALRNGAVLALHGCWNCTRLSAGYKVVFVPFDGAGNPGPVLDLVSGFVTDADAREVWGRPVDVIADGAGHLLISDDLAGVVYQLYPK